jgi:two-component system chemotaxis sensor kinase CheA
MDLRLIPLDQVVDAFPRLVRDLAREEDKEVDFEMQGTGIELDRRILNQIGDPLIHILRNAVDHGIEPPEEREAAGKPRRGSIQLRASRDRDEVSIEVEDDGGGLDPGMITEQAVEQGVRTRSELEAMDRSEVYDLMYESGFSTAEEVDDVSGRGVGMDVVSQTVDRLDGSLSVESEPGEGTVVRIQLPVTAAIAKVLFVEVGSEEYGVPIKNVDEVSRMASPEVVDGEDVVEHDEEIYPIVGLGEAFGVPDAGRNGDGVLIRVPPEERQVALRCDAVTQQEEVVIRPATGALGDVDGLSGTTVVGDGNVVPILDVTSI